MSTTPLFQCRLPEQAHEGIGVKPAFASEAKTSQRQGFCVQPRKPCGKGLCIEQHVVGAVSVLDFMVVLENGHAIFRRKDQVALFLETHIGFAAELMFEIADEIKPELRKLDVFRRRELLADAATGKASAPPGKAHVPFDDRDRALETMFFQIVGRRASDDPTAHNRNIDVFHHALS